MRCCCRWCVCLSVLCSMVLFILCSDDSFRLWFLFGLVVVLVVCWFSCKCKICEKVVFIVVIFFGFRLVSVFVLCRCLVVCIGWVFEVRVKIWVILIKIWLVYFFRLSRLFFLVVILLWKLSGIVVCRVLFVIRCRNDGVLVVSFSKMVCSCLLSLCWLISGCRLKKMLVLSKVVGLGCWI